MTPHQKNIRNFMLLTHQRCPEKPTVLSREEAALRVRLVFEKVFELAEALGVDILPQKSEAYLYFEDLSFDALNQSQQNLIDAADAIADLNYVTTGTAVALGLDMEPIENEVHRSNMSKIIGGKKDEFGKWVKPSTYSPANIEDIVKEQSK